MIRWHVGHYTISIELVIWLFVGFVGFLISSTQLREGFKDARYLRISGFNGARQAIARGFIRREAVRASAQVCNLILGWISLTLPAGPPPDAKMEVFAGMLIFIAASITINSLLDQRARRHVLDEIARRGL